MNSNNRTWGSEMSDVYNMQTLLNSLGYSLDVTVSDSSPKKNRGAPDVISISFL